MLSSCRADTHTFLWVIPNALDALDVQKHRALLSADHKFLPFENKDVEKDAAAVRRADRFLAYIGPVFRLMGKRFQPAWCTWSERDEAGCMRIRCLDRLPIPADLIVYFFLRPTNLHLVYHMSTAECSPHISEWSTRSSFIYSPHAKAKTEHIIPAEAVGANGSMQVEVHACLTGSYISILPLLILCFASRT